MENILALAVKILLIVKPREFIRYLLFYSIAAPHPKIKVTINQSANKSQE